MSDKETTDRPSPDMSGQDRPGPAMAGQDLRVTVEEAVVIFEEAELPRSKRAIRRYCQREDLDCKPMETATGQNQHSISVKSIERFIEQQKQIYSATGQRPSPDKTGPGRPWPAKTSAHATSAVLEDTLTFLKGEISVKNDQLKQKDSQIRELLERDRETHILIGQLQNMLSLPSPGNNSGVYDVTPKPENSDPDMAGQDQTDPDDKEQASPDTPHAPH